MIENPDTLGSEIDDGKNENRRYDFSGKNFDKKRSQYITKALDLLIFSAKINDDENFTKIAKYWLKEIFNKSYLNLLAPFAIPYKILLHTDFKNSRTIIETLLDWYQTRYNQPYNENSREYQCDFEERKERIIKYISIISTKNLYYLTENDFEEDDFKFDDVLVFRKQQYCLTLEKRGFFKSKLKSYETEDLSNESNKKVSVARRNSF